MLCTLEYSHIKLVSGPWHLSKKGEHQEHEKKSLEKETRCLLRMKTYFNTRNMTEESFRGLRVIMSTMAHGSIRGSYG